MKIGERIKEKRKELGLSLEQLATKLGKNRSTIYRYENGDIENMPLDILVPIADALNVTPAYLMGWDNDEEDTRKKIDVTTDILIRMEKDKNFADLIKILYKMDDSKIVAVKAMLDSLIQ